MASLIDCTLMEEPEGTDDECKLLHSNHHCIYCIYVLLSNVSCYHNISFFICSLQLKGSEAARTSSTWTSKWWWSLKTASLTPSSLWLRPDKRSLRGQVTSARYSMMSSKKTSPGFIHEGAATCKISFKTSFILWEEKPDDWTKMDLTAGLKFKAAIVKLCVN